MPKVKIQKRKTEEQRLRDLIGPFAPHMQLKKLREQMEERRRLENLLRQREEEEQEKERRRQDMFTMVRKGGSIKRNPREFAAGGMYKGKKHMYAAGGKVMDTPKKKPRRKK